MSQTGKLSIPFNRPYLTGRELSYVAEAHLNGQLAGDGKFTKLCQSWIEQLGNTKKALLTHSCTAALEMAAILCDIRPGDEVIMPSYTFVSTANAFVLRGAVPVFVDIRPDTLNIDEKKIEAAITPKTKAIVPVHYAGMACEMDTILDIAKRHGLYVVEDAAQACLSTYKGKQLGTLGDLGCFSFHETKNLICGEGGALLVNNPKMAERAEVIREKGTNRCNYLRREVDKYTWTDLGSSFLPGEIIAAFLWGQIQSSEEIMRERFSIWKRYNDLFENSEEFFKRQTPDGDSRHNAHMYYLVTHTKGRRQEIIDELRSEGIQCVFHYVPLHSSPFGMKNGRTIEALPVTEHVSQNLLRLPFWVGLEESVQLRIRNLVMDVIENQGAAKE